MVAKTITQQVAENIGAALRDPEVLTAIFGDFFRPIVRVALAEAISLEPEQIGSELVEEALKEAITAGYLARKWLEEKIPKTVATLKQQYGDQYEGWDDEEKASQVALNYLVVRDDLAITNAVRDELLRLKAS